MQGLLQTCLDVAWRRCWLDFRYRSWSWTILGAANCDDLRRRLRWQVLRRDDLRRRLRWHALRRDDPGRTGQSFLSCHACITHKLTKAANSTLQ